MSRKYVLNKRLDKAYDNYVKLYTEKKRQLNLRGARMADPSMLTKEEYISNREAQINAGRTTNINKTIVSEQAYVYTEKVARKLKKAAKEYDIEFWKDKTLLEIRSSSVDLSTINARLHKIQDENPEAFEKLMDRLPESIKKRTISKWISYEVFGSE